MLKFCKASRMRKKYSLNAKLQYAMKCIEWYKGQKDEPSENEVTQIEK